MGGLRVGGIGLLTLTMALGATAAEGRSCPEELEALDVPFQLASPRRGIETPVEITGPLGGVVYRTWGNKPLILDCSLVYSLAWAGRFFQNGEIREVFFSSAYQRRNIRGTNRPSKHSFGLAIDIHEFTTSDAKLAVAVDYEQGLGDDIDCIGAPLTRPGKTLRTLFCQLERSLLFRLVLTPDYDEDHYDHFHVEARPWAERTDWFRHEDVGSKVAVRSAAK